MSDKNKKNRFYTVSEKESKIGRAPKFGEALFIVTVIITLLVVLIIFLKIQAQIALTVSLFVASAFAMFLGYSWNKVEKMIMDGLSTGLLAMIINLMIGMLIAAWCVGGVVPYLVDVGMKIVSPRFFLPGTCIICCILYTLNAFSIIHFF